MITPRSFYFVEPRVPLGRMKDKVPVRMDPVRLQSAKAPWNKVKLSGAIEPRYFFCTLLAEHIFPFAHHGFVPVTLPIEIEEAKWRPVPQATLYQRHNEKSTLRSCSLIRRSKQTLGK